MDYYQHHRTHILTNIARSGDVIHYKNNQAQANDKIVGCAFKNYILFNVIWDIYLRLVEYIQTHYQLTMVARHRLTVRIFQQYSEIPQRNETSGILKCSQSTVKQVKSCSISEQPAV